MEKTELIELALNDVGVGEDRDDKQQGRASGRREVDSTCGQLRAAELNAAANG